MEHGLSSRLLDVTERKRAEEKFRAVVEFAPTAMVMIDKSGAIMLVNTQTEKPPAASSAACR